MLAVLGIYINIIVWTRRGDIDQEALIISPRRLRPLPSPTTDEVVLISLQLTDSMKLNSVGTLLVLGMSTIRLQTSAGKHEYVYRNAASRESLPSV